MKENIVHLKKEIVEAKARQAQAKTDVKNIERDMNEFKNNKGGKLAELRTSVEALKKQVSEQSQTMKAVQKEYQSAQLERGNLQFGISFLVHF